MPANTDSIYSDLSRTKEKRQTKRNMEKKHHQITEYSRPDSAEQQPTELNGAPLLTSQALDGTEWTEGGSEFIIRKEKLCVRTCLRMVAVCRSRCDQGIRKSFDLIKRNGNNAQSVRFRNKSDIKLKPTVHK